jgi:uncharacterized repeat protein (TIGR04076 family)
MKRREFLEKSGCGAACFVAAPFAAAGLPEVEQSGSRRYEFEIEIYEAREDTWCHKKGDKFKYPDEMGKICPWLTGSMRDFITALQHGAVLSWKYEGTPYEKVIDPDKVTTEFVRCPDPTADLVAKITRTRVS